ncbi:MAG TPA: VF530 family protein [Gemmatimonadaceae bacterium]
MPNSPRDPLHGVTLEAMIEHLRDRYGWEGLGARIDNRCFTDTPSVASSLKFLRKTPWARAKVESLYRHSVAHPRKGATPAAGDAQADEEP